MVVDERPHIPDRPGDPSGDGGRGPPRTSLWVRPEGCGGCQWQHIGLDAQVEFKRQILIDAIRRIGQIECPELSETVGLPPWNFRTSLRATVVDGRAALGRARSNEGIPVPGCLVVHPLLVELLDGRRYPGGDELLLRCGARTGERLVSVRPRRIVADVPGDVRSDSVHQLAAGRTWRVSAGSSPVPT